MVSAAERSRESKGEGVESDVNYTEDGRQERVTVGVRVSINNTESGWRERVRVRGRGRGRVRVS